MFAENWRGLFYGDRPKNVMGSLIQAQAKRAAVELERRRHTTLCVLLGLNAGVQFAVLIATLLRG